ncbi:MAG: hypothetical protein ACK5AQ_09400, partial [Bacteroidota bacterium]
GIHLQVGNQFGNILYFIRDGSVLIGLQKVLGIGLRKVSYAQILEIHIGVIGCKHFAQRGFPRLPWTGMPITGNFCKASLTCGSISWVKAMIWKI